MSLIEIDDLKQRLLSDDFETQIIAVKQADIAIKEIVDMAVRGFYKSTNPLIYGDCLSHFGPPIVPKLEELYAATPDGDAKTIAALLLLFLGSRAGLSDALNALTPENPNNCLAATKLADAHITEAGDAILKLLRTVISSGPLEPKDAPTISALTFALKKLGRSIPIDIVDHLNQAGSYFHLT